MPETRGALSENPALYRNFAALDLTEAAILTFANQHGLLGEPESVGIEGGGLSFGEPWERWADAIPEIAKLIALWEAARRGDLEHVRRFYKEDPSIYIDARGGFGDWPEGFDEPALYQGTPLADRQGFAIAEPTDLMTARWFCEFRVRTALNTRLDGVVSPVVKRPPGGGLRCRFEPKTMLAGMWLQFAMSLESDLTFRQCPRCRKWFTIRADKGSRTTRKFCSNSCRTASYKARREEKHVQALQMAKDGKKPAAIAKKLGVQATIVRDWIATEGKVK